MLLWDRPNCGQSDLSFDGETKSRLHADTLAALIRKLDLGRTALVGGSAGSRVSLIAAVHNPDITSHLVLWWISGGTIGSLALAMIYCGDPANLASKGGMEAASKSFGWAEQCDVNPRIRDALLAQDPKAFIAKMQKWAAAYIPAPNSPMPGMTPETFASIKVPVIFRSGDSDLSHTRETTDLVHKKQSALEDDRSTLGRPGVE